MKRAFGMVGVLILAAAIGYGWYFFHGPVHGLEVHPKPPATALASGSESALETPAETAQPAASPTISVEPSPDVVENFPARITIRDGEQTFVAEYTGQYRRIKQVIISINIYDIASYVHEPTKGDTLELLDGLLVDGKAKVYMIRFLNDLPARPLLNDIYKDINTSFTDVDLERLRENIDNFCSQFKNGSRNGDTVYVVWLPGGKIYSAYNSMDPLPLLARDIPFARALWRNWAGPRRGDIRFNLVRQYANETALRD